MTTVHWDARADQADRPPVRRVGRLGLRWRCGTGRPGGDGRVLLLDVLLEADGTATLGAWLESTPETAPRLEAARVRPAARGHAGEIQFMAQAPQSVIVPPTPARVRCTALSGRHAGDIHVDVHLAGSNGHDGDGPHACIPELLAMFRHGQLVYVRSRIPALAGLRGATYELDSWTFEQPG